MFKKIFRKFVMVLGIAIAVTAAGQANLLAPIDDALRGWRFGWNNAPVTGDVVVVEIDPRSLQEIGVWPWPRSIHARLIDALLEYGAAEIAFDIDFSSQSTAEEDAAFAASLERAGGFVILPAFKQPVVTETGQPAELINQPVEMFARAAWPAAVNVIADSDGRVRRYPYAVDLGTQSVRSLPAVLAGRQVEQESRFLIDFSLDATQIDRIAYIDVLERRIDLARLAGKQVIVGAGAVELADNFAVPRYGVLTGPMTQALATETLLQGRELTVVGPWLAFEFLIALGVFFVLCMKKLTPPSLVAGMAIGALVTEAIAIHVMGEWHLVFNTAAVHIGSFAMLQGFVITEWDLRGLLMRRTRKQYVATRAVLDRVIADHFDAVVVVNGAGEIVATSRPADEMLGAGQSLVGNRAATVLPSALADPVAAALNPGAGEVSARDTPVETTLRHTRKGGGDIIIEYVVTASDVPASEEDMAPTAPSRVVCLTFRDITERTARLRQIKYEADHDPLTGALSRTRMVAKIQEFLDLWSGAEQALTIVLIDLDRFKNVNETLGHSVGDELLRQVARRLEASGAYCVARLGADRFAMALPGLLDAAGQERLAQSIIKDVVEPYELGEHKALIGVSIGITDIRRSGIDTDILLAHADMALSEAKNIPGNSYSVFETELDARVQRKQAVEVALREAIAHGEMSIVYQPQVDLATGDAIGAEALLRWHHPEMGHVSPDLFIPVAEDSGLIMEIGRWVLLNACQDAARWPAPARLAVNVSALQFEYGDAVADIEAALAVSGLAPERLDIEITESVFIHKTDAFVKKLQAIRERGVEVALDDFGMGYSSLGYLSRLPVDKLKVDRSFVRHLPDDHEAMAIIRSVLTLAETMHKAVIAEGIETADQAWVLRLAGCKTGQGYHFGRPQTQREFCELLALEGPAFRLRAIA